MNEYNHKNTPQKTTGIRYSLHLLEAYGEVNSVKNTTINIWLNDGDY